MTIGGFSYFIMTASNPHAFCKLVLFFFFIPFFPLKNPKEWINISKKLGWSTRGGEGRGGEGRGGEGRGIHQGKLRQPEGLYTLHEAPHYRQGHFLSTGYCFWTSSQSVQYLLGRLWCHICVASEPANDDGWLFGLTAQIYVPVPVLIKRLMPFSHALFCFHFHDK